MYPDMVAGMNWGNGYPGLWSGIFTFFNWTTYSEGGNTDWQQTGSPALGHRFVLFIYYFGRDTNLNRRTDMEGYIRGNYYNGSYPAKWMAFEYTDNKFTLDGRPWEEVFDDIEKMSTIQAADELEKFRNGWDMHGKRLCTSGYWQKHLPSELQGKVDRRYIDIKSRINCELYEMRKQKITEYNDQMEPILDKYKEFMDRYRQICTDVLQEKTIPFKVKRNRNARKLTIACRYTPHEVKKMLIFCLLVTALTFDMKLQCMSKMDMIDKRVAKFNQGKNIEPVDTKELDTINIIKEVKSFLKELTLDPERSNIQLEFSTLLYKLHRDY